MKPIVYADGGMYSGMQLVGLWKVGVGLEMVLGRLGKDGGLLDLTCEFGAFCQRSMFRVLEDQRLEDCFFGSGETSQIGCFRVVVVVVVVVGGCVEGRKDWMNSLEIKEWQANSSVVAVYPMCRIRESRGVDGTETRTRGWVGLGWLKRERERERDERSGRNDVTGTSRGAGQSAPFRTW